MKRAEEHTQIGDLSYVIRNVVFIAKRYPVMYAKKTNVGVAFLIDNCDYRKNDAMIVFAVHAAANIYVNGVTSLHPSVVIVLCNVA